MTRLTPIPERAPVPDGPGSLPRRDEGLFKEIEERARVTLFCRNLWAKRRSKDTFIGFVNTVDWKLYIAPCFGVTYEMQKSLWKDGFEAAIARVKGMPETYVESGAEKLVTVRYSSTSTDSGDGTCTVREIEQHYGRGNACYAILDDKNQFDARSHGALASWIKSVCDNSFDPTNALGFAIQRDNMSYYIRFASGYNERRGAEAGAPTATFKGFDAHRDKYPNKEPRDLPREWALLVERVLARDLELSLIKLRPGLRKQRFERMTSRGEQQKTKLTRFIPEDPRVEGIWPKTVGTGNLAIGHS